VYDAWLTRESPSEFVGSVSLFQTGVWEVLVHGNALPVQIFQVIEVISCSALLPVDIAALHDAFGLQPLYGAVPTSGLVGSGASSSAPLLCYHCWCCLLLKHNIRH